ncbi:MAG: L-dopachrome tautomerase-related protein [Oceanidesulfovibrio sp.]
MRPVRGVSLAIILLLSLFTFAVFSSRDKAPAGVASVATQSLPDPSSLEIVAMLTEAPGNIAVTPQGRIFISMHQFYGPRMRVMELVDGRLIPYPNLAWASAPEGGGVGLEAVLGIRSDPDGVLWLLDNGGDASTPKLVAWDTVHETLRHVFELPKPEDVQYSFLNDLAVDPEHGLIYIADTAGAQAAILVVDMETGASRRLLAGHVSVMADANVTIEFETGRSVTRIGPNGGKEEWKVPLNPITVDAEYEWLYYGPMHGNTLFRIRTDDIADVFAGRRSAKSLGERVEAFGTKPPCDGITMDAGGNVYITDIGNAAVGVVDPTGHYRTLYRDPALLDWVDGLANGPDGYIYGTVNKLHRSAPLSGGHGSATPPFYVVRFPALVNTAPGR